MAIWILFILPGFLLRVGKILNMSHYVFSMSSRKAIVKLNCYISKKTHSIYYFKIVYPRILLFLQHTLTHSWIPRCHLLTRRKAWWIGWCYIYLFLAIIREMSQNIILPFLSILRILTLRLNIHIYVNQVT